MPAPIHVLLHRQTFLHIGLSSAVDRLCKSAIVANVRDGYWFEDEVKQLPLRWHLFAGVLYDLLHGCCDGNDSKSIIPWRIRLHFTSYPFDEILRCQDAAVTVRKSFANSLKQSLYLQYDNAKVAMQVSKQSHDNLWGAAITRSNFAKFSEFCKEFMANEDRLSFIPIRVYVDNRPPIQRPCKVHISTDPQHDKINEHPLTLKQLLQEWLPHIFDDKVAAVKDNNESIFKSSAVRWRVQGMQLPLSMKVIDIWRTLCSPDLFLYITIRTT